METSSLPTDELVNRLIGLHRADFSRTEKYARYRFYADIATASLAALGALLPVSVLPYLFSVAALVAAGLRCLWKIREVRVRQTAEKCRRVLVMIHGLGWRVSHKGLTDLISECESSEAEGRKFEKDNYYSAPPTTGPQALAYTLQESAFWSKFLLTKSAQQSALWTVGLVVVSVFVLLVTPAVARASWLLGTFQIVNIVLMFVVTSDLLGNTVDYSSAARAVSEIDGRLEHIVATGAPLGDVMLAFTDYNSAVESAPKIPDRIYEKHQAYLNKLWNERVAQ